MIFELLQTGLVDRVAEKSAKMAELDPSGWTLTIVCVLLVFFVLLILYVIYALVGETFMAIDRRNARRCAANDEEVAAAIAVALQLYTTGKDEVHDEESGIITIKR